MDTQYLDTFLTGLKSYMDAQADSRKAYNREVALEFNPMLQFFSIGENKFSDIIAYFLNPQEKHGQGSAFLEAFLKMEGLPCCQWEGLNLERAKVVRESGVNSRRMDIYIHFPESNYGIGIEMKIWAGDQKDQLQDYHTWLKDKHGNEQCLFYWRPYDNKPGEHSLSEDDRDKLIKARQFYEINHEEWTVALLEKWLTVCRAENVRTFLKQLLQFINHEVNGERFMGQHKTITDYLLQDTARLEAAAQIIEAQDVIREKVLRAFKTALQEYRQWPQGVELENMGRFLWNHTYASFSFKTRSDFPYNVNFEWEQQNFRAGYYGFTRKDGKPTEADKAFLNNVFGKARDSNHWPWFRDWEGSYRNLKMTDLFGSGKDAFLKAISEKIQFLLASLQKVEFPEAIEVVGPNTASD